MGALREVSESSSKSSRSGPLVSRPLPSQGPGGSLGWGEARPRSLQGPVLVPSDEEASETEPETHINTAHRAHHIHVCNRRAKTPRARIEVSSLGLWC